MVTMTRLREQFQEWQAFGEISSLLWLTNDVMCYLDDHAVEAGLTVIRIDDAEVATSELLQAAIEKCNSCTKFKLLVNQLCQHVSEEGAFAYTMCKEG